MEKQSNTKDTVEKLQSGNASLYFACLLVGILTGVIVSLYRWSLEKIGVLRKAYFSDITLEHPISLLKIWLVFIIVGLVVNYLFKKLFYNLFYFGC